MNSKGMVRLQAQAFSLN